MLNLQNEISRVPPPDAPIRTFSGGEPILYAFNCALLERVTDKGFIYKAVNLINGKSEMMSHRINPLSPRDVVKMVERIRQSKIAGAGRYEIDRPLPVLVIIFFKSTKRTSLGIINFIFPSPYLSCSKLLLIS